MRSLALLILVGFAVTLACGPPLELAWQFEAATPTSDGRGFVFFHRDAEYRTRPVFLFGGTQRDYRRDVWTIGHYELATERIRVFERSDRRRGALGGAPMVLDRCFGDRVLVFEYAVGDLAARTRVFDVRSGESTVVPIDDELSRLGYTRCSVPTLVAADGALVVTALKDDRLGDRGFQALLRTSSGDWSDVARIGAVHDVGAGGVVWGVRLDAKGWYSFTSSAPKARERTFEDRRKAMPGDPDGTRVACGRDGSRNVVIVRRGAELTEIRIPRGTLK